MLNERGPFRKAESMKQLPNLEGLNVSPARDSDSDESSSIFNSDNERPVSHSQDSIQSPPPINKRLRVSLSK